MEAVTFGEDLEDPAFLPFILDGFHRMHAGGIVAIADLGDDFGDALGLEGAHDLVVDVGEADEVILRLLAWRLVHEGHVEAIKGWQEVVEEAFGPVFEGLPPLLI